MYDNWITGIYNTYDGIFKYHEHEDQIKWLEGLIKEKLGKEALYDEDGIYRWAPKETYEGYEYKHTTDGQTDLAREKRKQELDDIGAP